MRNINEIIINKAAVNVLDKEHDNVVFSDCEIILNEISYEYIEKHILKLFKNDDARTARFTGEQNIVRQLCKEIFEDSETFISNTRKLAKYFYRCMCNDEQEASGDFVVCLFESQAGNYMALIKLDFTETYFNSTRGSEGKTEVELALVRNGLPNPSQKVSKAAIIKESEDGENFMLLVMGKAWNSTFVQAFLRCESARDRQENTKIFQEVAERFARRAFKDNAPEAERFRNKMAEHLQNEDSISIDKLAEVNIGDAMLKAEFKAVIASEGITENDVPIDREWAAKKLQRKRLKIDKSIELYIDAEAYKDKDRFEIKRNGDGTIDIILKNVRNYIEK